MWRPCLYNAWRGLVKWCEARQIILNNIATSLNLGCYFNQCGLKTTELPPLIPTLIHKAREGNLSMQATKHFIRCTPKSFSTAIIAVLNEWMGVRCNYYTWLPITWALGNLKLMLTWTKLDFPGLDPYLCCNFTFNNSNPREGETCSHSKQ